MLTVRAANASRRRLQDENHRIQLLELQLSALNPMNILEKGFALPVKNGKKIDSASTLKSGDRILVILKDGSADCEVNNVKND